MLPKFLCKRWHKEGLWKFLVRDRGEVIYFCRRCEKQRIVKEERKGFWDNNPMDG